MVGIRRQLAAYSPLSFGSLMGALVRRALAGAEELRAARELIGERFSSDCVHLVDSGRSALQLAIRAAMARSQGPRVIGVPAFSCFEVASAAVGADCGIALYDLDPATLAPDLDSLKALLRAGVQSIVVAPLYGVPVDWDIISPMLDEFGAIAIEDAAQGHGASWRGARLGSFGALSVISFGRGKGWTGGGGGALCMRGIFASDLTSASLDLRHTRGASEARIVASALVQWIAGRPSLYGVPASIPALGLGETHYHAPVPPQKESSFSAALLQRTEAASDREADARRASAEQWRANLPTRLLSGLPLVPADGLAGYVRFPIRLRPSLAERARSPAARRLGVAPSYPSLLSTLTPVAKRLVGTQQHFPGAETLVTELVTLPTHSRVAESDRRHILALLAENGVAP